MSEYVGIKAGELHERTELSEYYCARCGCPVTDHDSYCRECGGAFQRSFATEPCDRDALLALAVELDELENHYDDKYKDTYNLFYSGVAEGIYIAKDMLHEVLGVDDA